MLARRFLGCILVLTLLAVAGAFLMYQFGDRVLADMATPKGHYVAPADSPDPDYADSGNWLAQPGTGSPANWLPSGFASDPTVTQDAATFFVHPTTYLTTDRWNAPLLPGGETEVRNLLFVRSQASAFNAVSKVWAPRYRQAAFGAFLQRNQDARQALDLAYTDVDRAFARFLAENPKGPLILAGHSQGALQLLRLLAEHGPALKDRLVAAYVIGWPVGITADLPATGLPPCDRADETGCVLSWQGFKNPANPALVLDAWVGTKGLAGPVRRQDDMLCVDPISGRRDGASPADANPGTLVPNASFSDATVLPAIVGAHCEHGFLIVDGDLPKMGSFALPGNNLHPYDYALFWGAIRADVARRLDAFEKAR